MNLLILIVMEPRNFELVGKPASVRRVLSRAMSSLASAPSLGHTCRGDSIGLSELPGIHNLINSISSAVIVLVFSIATGSFDSDSLLN